MSRRPSPLDNEQCRQCTSFSDYVKVTKKKMSTKKCAPKEEQEQQREVTRRTDCPLDKDELGRNSWGLLHTMAAKYPVTPTKEDETQMAGFFKSFARFYPCESCAKDLKKDLEKNPPETCSNKTLTQWLCQMHNRVNVKLGKDEFDCSQVDQRWKDGWPDGSCDLPPP